MPKKKTTGFELETVDITRSYARKLNMGAHGGAQYETLDLFSSLTAKNVPIAEAKTVSLELYESCKAEVEKEIKKIDEVLETQDLPDADPAPVKKAPKDEMTLGIKIAQTELEEITSYVNDLTLAKTLDDLKEAAAGIRSASEELTKKQKSYLAMYYKKRLAALNQND